MARKKRYLTARMADDYVKTSGPTAATFTQYWRIVAHLHNGKTEVFWGHTYSAEEAAGKETLTEKAAERHGWKRFDFEVLELSEHRKCSLREPPLLACCTNVPPYVTPTAARC